MVSSILFPNPARDFPGQRWTRITLRTFHLIFMAHLMGAIALGYPSSELSFVVLGTILSGILFMGVEIYHTCVWFFQVKGWVVILKIVLMVLAGMYHDAAQPLMIAIIVIGSISSHMPGRYRYYSVFHGRLLKE